MRRASYRDNIERRCRNGRQPLKTNDLHMCLSVYTVRCTTCTTGALGRCHRRSHQRQQQLQKMTKKKTTITNMAAAKTAYLWRHNAFWPLPMVTYTSHVITPRRFSARWRRSTRPARCVETLCASLHDWFTHTHTHTHTHQWETESASSMDPSSQNMRTAWRRCSVCCLFEIRIV